jgi:uncharacterized membrane protein
MATVDYNIISKPNCSLTSQAKVKLFLLLAIIPVLVGLSFTMLGLWMVFPFIGLELLGLGYAFYYLNSHAGDFESISIVDDRLVVEKHSMQQTRQFVLNTYWAKLVISHARNGNLQLYLRSKGKDLEIGNFMNNEQRCALAEQLKTRISSLQIAD